MEEWIESAKTFAEATDIETKVIDHLGKVIYCSHDGYKDHALCQHIPGNMCRESHVFGASQALKFDNSYIFFCPAGMVHFVSPIIKNGVMVGAIISGHFLMTEPDVYLIRHLMKYVDDEKVIKDFVMHARVFSTKRVSALAKILKSMTIELSDQSQGIVEDIVGLDLSEAKHLHSIHQVIDHIRNQYMERLTLDEAADLVHFTPQYFSKIFKEETGYTFKQYLNHIRIERSKSLLQQEDLTLADIALMTGFSDQSHFSKSFKKITGMNPTTYQKSTSVY